MFFNNWIALFSEMYLFFGMCVALNFKHFYFQSYGNAINSILAVFFGLALSAFPLFVGTFYQRFTKHYNVFNSKLDFEAVRDFLARYGNGIEGLNFKRQGNKVLVYQCASLLQKLSLILTVVFLQDYPVFSTFIFNFSSLIMITISGYTEPYDS
jgi:hypothetical protein